LKRNLLNDTATRSRASPAIIPRSEHSLSRSNVSPNALKVLYRLRNSGFEAFLVGGGVRDLLLGRHPKDFDVATNALPEQIEDLFGNCRLIGRRFRLAHVRFGRDVVEVATFRATSAEPEDERAHSDSGRILRDNVYGTIDEDVWRRDFTVNALYYNIADFSVWDYVGGLKDIQSRTLRLIGDPETRYREDPVRMLRVVRFAAKLDFTIAPEAEEPLARLGTQLRDVPPARLFDELLKLFHAGHARRSFDLLVHYDLFRYLFSHTQQVLDGPKREATLEFIRRGLENTDERVRADKPVTPMFLYAVFLWPPIRELALELTAEGWNETHAMVEASGRILARQQTAFPRRFSAPMREMLAMQWRFSHRQGVRAVRLLQHKRFRAAYDFMLLRAQCGEIEQAVADWWTEVQTLPPPEQQKALGLSRGPRRRRRGGRRRSEARSGAGSNDMSDTAP
jgi:poly(A) polymerase